MNTTPLPEPCARFEARLPDYLDGALAPAEQAEAARHAAGCERCGPLAADLAAIARAAAALPPLRPERDLWAGIAARIEPAVVPLADRRPAAAADVAVGAGAASAAPAARATHVAVPRRWLAAAAAALVAVSAGVSWQAAHRFGGPDAPAAVAARDRAAAPALGAADVPTQPLRPPGQEETRYAAAAPAPAGAARPGAQASDGGVRPSFPGRPPERAGDARLVAAPLAAAERTYDAELTELGRILDERRAELDSGTVAVLERNLQVIDAAIAESRRALERDPASRFLGDQLTRAYDRKVRLMRTAALLPSQL